MTVGRRRRCEGWKDGDKATRLTLDSAGSVPPRPARPWRSSSAHRRMGCRAACWTLLGPARGLSDLSLARGARACRGAEPIGWATQSVQITLC